MVGLPCLVESVCQVARSWVDVGSFHTHLFGVVYVTCGNFHDGSKKVTASVHQILCQSWEKCYGDPHNDSTSLRGPKLELCAGVSTARLVQDRSHICWRWRTHRETHKLHKSWSCCTNSRARPSGSTSDHSRHCWGGGNWLWDMPTGSDGRIGHAPCRSQICAQDPDRWPDTAAHSLQWTELNWKTKWLSSLTHPTPLIWHPVTSSYFQNWNWSWEDASLIPMRRYRPNRRECLTLWYERTYRKCSKNGGKGGTGVYMQDRTTSRVAAAERPYGEFYDFYSTSPENFGYHLVFITPRVLKTNGSLTWASCFRQILLLHIDHSMALGSTQPLVKMSSQNISWGVQAAGAWGWQPHHLHVLNVMEIWEPKPPGTLWAAAGLLRDSFTFYY